MAFFFFRSFDIYSASSEKHCTSHFSNFGPVQQSWHAEKTRSFPQNTHKMWPKVLHIPWTKWFVCFAETVFMPIPVCSIHRALPFLLIYEFRLLLSLVYPIRVLSIWFISLVSPSFLFSSWKNVMNVIESNTERRKNSKQ